MEPDINNYTDEQFDELIRQSFQRQQTIEDINVSVMRQLRHTSRRRSLLKWGRLAAFAFGLPLLLLLFGWLLWLSVSQQEALQFSVFNHQVPIIACFLLPIAAMLYVTWCAVKNFSIRDV